MLAIIFEQRKTRFSKRLKTRGKVKENKNQGIRTHTTCVGTYMCVREGGRYYIKCRAHLHGGLMRSFRHENKKNVYAIYTKNLKRGGKTSSSWDVRKNQSFFASTKETTTQCAIRFKAAAEEESISRERGGRLRCKMYPAIVPRSNAKLAFISLVSTNTCMHARA